MLFPVPLYSELPSWSALLHGLSGLPRFPSLDTICLGSLALATHANLFLPEGGRSDLCSCNISWLSILPWAKANALD